MNIVNYLFLIDNLLAMIDMTNIKFEVSYYKDIKT